MKIKISSEGVSLSFGAGLFFDASHGKGAGRVSCDIEKIGAGKVARQLFGIGVCRGHINDDLVPTWSERCSVDIKMSGELFKTSLMAAGYL